MHARPSCRVPMHGQVQQLVFCPVATTMAFRNMSSADKADILASLARSPTLYLDGSPRAGQVRGLDPVSASTVFAALPPTCMDLHGLMYHMELVDKAAAHRNMNSAKFA